MSTPSAKNEDELMMEPEWGQFRDVALRAGRPYYGRTSGRLNLPFRRLRSVIDVNRMADDLLFSARNPGP